MIRTITILTLLLLISFQGFAQREDKGARPVLNGHSFIPLSVNRTPFTNSKITMPLGFGQTNGFDFPLPDIGPIDSLPTLDGEVIFATLGLQYRQKVRQNVAFYTRIEIAARVGTDINSLLLEGLDNVISFELGTMINVWETEKISLSTSARVMNLEGNFLDIKGYIQDLLDSSAVDPSISETVPALNAGVGVHFAWGISPTFGFTSSMSLTYGETFTRGNSDFRFAIGGFLEADFKPRFNVPIGLSFGLFTTTEPEFVYVDDKSAQVYITKLSYTGRSDFNFGIELGKATIPFESTETRPSVDLFQLSMSYYFN